MKVLHLGVGNLYGGIETMLVTLARHRHECPEMEPHFTICFHGRFSEELRQTGVQVHDLGETRYSRPWTVWMTRRRMARLLDREKFDIVVDHSCWTRGLYGKVLQRSQVPSAFWMHAPAEGTHWLERRARRYSPQVVIANSRFTQNTVDRLFPGVRSEVIHPPVDLPAMDRSKREGIRKTLKTSPQAVVILIAARMEAIKGHAVLLNALAKLRDLPDWVCWIAGGVQRPSEVEYEKELKAQSQQWQIEERFRWLGQRSDVLDLMVAADLYCQPNTAPESFGISFVEAIHAGLPIITTSIGGALEMIGEGSGTFVPPHDSQQLAEKLKERILNRDHRLCTSQAGPIRAKELCDPGQQMQRLAKCLHR